MEGGCDVVEVVPDSVDVLVGMSVAIIGVATGSDGEDAFCVVAFLDPLVKSLNRLDKMASSPGGPPVISELPDIITVLLIGPLREEVDVNDGVAVSCDEELRFLEALVRDDDSAGEEVLVELLEVDGVVLLLRIGRITACTKFPSAML